VTTDAQSEVDVLVFGAGMGGMCAALFAALHGFSVLLCEKTDKVGGTTATSAGTVWIPGAREGDDPAAAERYLDAEVGNRGDRDLRAAFLESGPEALATLQNRTEAKFRPVVPHPDYHPDLPGWSAEGRGFAPMPFDGKKLGRDFALVRPPIAPFMVLGGLMLGRDDIPHFVKPFGSIASFRHVAGIVLRHAADRLGHERGTRLVMGNALVARLLFSLRRAGVPLSLGSRLVDLSDAQHAVVETNGVKRRLQARRGIVLATGGFSHNATLRASLVGRPDAARSAAFAGDTGDGLTAARALGAAYGEAHGPAFWTPVSVLRETIFPHIVLDRAKPGLIAVNAAGRRFVNEAASYHDFVEAMLRTDSVPAWLVCDRAFIRDYGIGLIHPGSSDATLRRFIEASYLRTGKSPGELAAQLGIDRGVFEGTVDRHNRAAVAGVDDEFDKGGNAFNRHNGDPRNKPNPCLRPIAAPPFFAVEVHPADLGTSVGLRTDRDARVLRDDGSAIDGLYACGNDMNSIMAGSYPGPGITLGPAMVFAYRAVRHMAGAQT
jgi:succinate dehydrogenase/fumarate reductase flavoprotein subunit